MKRRLFLLGGILSAAAVALGIRRTQTVREWMAAQGITVEVRRFAWEDGMRRAIELKMGDKCGSRACARDTDEAVSEAIDRLRGRTMRFHKLRLTGADHDWGVHQVFTPSDTISITFPKDLA